MDNDALLFINFAFFQWFIVSLFVIDTRSPNRWEAATYYNT